MGEEIMPHWFAELLAAYGPAALPIVGLLLIIKYLIDDRKLTKAEYVEENKNLKSEIKIERDKNEQLQAELLREARGNAMLAEELKRALQVLADRRTA